MAAGGTRVGWWELPFQVRAALEARLGSAPVEAATQPGGFSPGLAARLRLADGRRVFLKAVGSERDLDAPNLHRSEARVAAALPASVAAPRLLWSLEVAGWVALAFEDIDGRPPSEPWRPADLERVLAAMTRLAMALTPAPIQAPPIAEATAGTFNGWERLAASGSPVPEPWAAANLTRLVRLESGWATAAAGVSLLHGDIRSDNILLTSERVFFVDWPWARIGAAWLDLLWFLPSLALEGGPEPDAVFTGHPLAAGAEPAAVDAALAALAGFFVSQSILPAPANLPRLREFQRAQGRTALRWLARRLGPAAG